MPTYTPGRCLQSSIKPEVRNVRYDTIRDAILTCAREYSIPIRAKKFRFDSILATESIFFDSIRQSDKFAACTLTFK